MCGNQTNERLDVSQSTDHALNAAERCATIISAFLPPGVNHTVVFEFRKIIEESIRRARCQGEGE